MSPPFRLRMAKQKAEAFLREEGLDALPVDPFSIADSRSILVQPKPDTADGVSGMLLRHGNNFGIMYATYIASDGFQRSRMSDSGQLVNVCNLREAEPRSLASGTMANIMRRTRLRPTDMHRTSQGWTFAPGQHASIPGCYGVPTIAAQRQCRMLIDTVEIDGKLGVHLAPDGDKEDRTLPNLFAGSKGIDFNDGAR